MSISDNTKTKWDKSYGWCGFNYNYFSSTPTHRICLHDNLNKFKISGGDRVIKINVDPSIISKLTNIRNVSFDELRNEVSFDASFNNGVYDGGWINTKKNGFGIILNIIICL